LMVRILHILSVVALISAGGLLVLAARNVRRNDAHVADIAAPSVVTRFRQANRTNANKNRPQTSPLVRVAEAYAAYLNPPPPVKRDSKARPQEERSTTAVPVSQVRPANPTAKFKLHGISYRPAKPEQSMALIWEPDTGHRWVREGMQLGHIMITEISGDSLIYTDGKRVHEMALDLGQATTVFAQRSQDRAAPQQDERSTHIVSHWAPVRRIRQIPAARAAAKIGVKLQDASMETR
jgi:hypothetical protein